MVIVPIPRMAGKEMAKEAAGLIRKFLGPGVEEASEIVRERIRLFRLQRELALLRKAEQIVKDAGFSPKPVGMRTLFPLLDIAVLENEEDMVERWASLLASAANPNNEFRSEASFVEILKQLAPTHAYLLDVFYEQVSRDKLPPDQWDERGYVLSDLRAFLKKEVPDFDVAIGNLFRLNLVAYPTAKLGIANGQEVRIQVTSGNILCATSLGQAFTSACGHGRTHRATSYGVPGNSITNVFWTRGGSLNMRPVPPTQGS